MIIFEEDKIFLIHCITKGCITSTKRVKFMIIEAYAASTSTIIAILHRKDELCTKLQRSWYVKFEDTGGVKSSLFLSMIVH